MKEAGILHPELARIVAEMGHGDLLAVADAGLPIPSEVERVDLAFARGRPGFLEVVEAILGELRTEACVFATQSRDSCPKLIDEVARMTGIAEVSWVDHEELKVLVVSARAVVRTGEFTPYANVLLRSGVDLSA